MVAFGVLVVGEGYSRGQEKDIGLAPGERCDEIWHEVRRVAKGCTESRHVVSIGRGEGRGIDAEMA